MRQRAIAHEQAIDKIMRQALEASTGAAHLQMVADRLGVAMSVQEGRVAGIEQHTAQLTSSIEALRSFQEGQYPGAPPKAAFSASGQGDR